MKSAGKLLKFLFRFKCPKCDISSFEAKAMQDHLLWCQKDLDQGELFDLVDDEISKELNDITMLTETNDDNQNSFDFEGFEFEESNSQLDVNSGKPNSMNVLQSKSLGDKTVENLDDENENVPAIIENFEETKGPKIDAVFSREQALGFHYSSISFSFHENNGAGNTKKAESIKVAESIRGIESIRGTESIKGAKLNDNQMNKTNMNYIRPRLTQQRARLFVCRWKNCGEKFGSNFDRMKHFQTHTGGKPFDCEWKNCGKKFARVYDRNRHYLVHTGEKPFVCTWKNCGDKFRTSGARIIHYRIHTGEKPFICDWKGCSNRFKSSSDLWNHSKKHSTL